MCIVMSCCICECDVVVLCRAQQHPRGELRQLHEFVFELFKFLIMFVLYGLSRRVAVDGDAWNLVDEALSKYMHSIGYIILAVLVVICEWYRQPRHTSKGVLKNEDMNCRLNTGN